MGFDIERNALRLPCPSHDNQEPAPKAPDLSDRASAAADLLLQ